MNADEINLVKKYRSLGLLVDTNLLMLLWVGRWNSAFISRHKRTNQFDANDYGLLEMLVELFTKVVVTPCILAEASNLVRQSGGKDSGSGSLSEKLMEQFGLLDERHIESIVVADSAAFISLTPSNYFHESYHAILFAPDTARVAGNTAYRFNDVVRECRISCRRRWPARFRR